MDLRETLETYCYNLDLLIDDIERLEKHQRIQVFFDTAHLVSAVVGLHEFYGRTGSFRQSKFDSPTALVTSLAASSWLGEISLLPPHQAEFLRKWKLDFGVDSTKRPEVLAKKFLRDVGYTDNSWTTKRSLAILSDEEIRRLIIKDAASAPKFFKAVQSIFPWQGRMKKMLDDEVLGLDSTFDDYERVMNSVWPEQLTNVFNRERPNMSFNNIADALAIAILVERVNAFKNDETKNLPILFPSDLLLDSVHDPNLEAELTYGHTPEGRPITAVRDPMYFVFKARFSTKNSRRTSKISKETESQLRNLRKEIATLLEVNDEISIDKVAQKKAFGKPLSELIEDIGKFSFLDNVWLKASEAPADLRSAIREVSEAREDFRRSKRVHNQATRILEEKIHLLSANVGEIEWLIELWADLENQGMKLNRETLSEDLKTRDFFRDRGLLRYSFPDKTRSTIDAVLRELGGTAFGEARRLVINACLKGIKDPTGERDELVTGAAVLLALGMNWQLIRLLKRVDPHLPHFSIKIAYVEQIFLQREDLHRGESLLEEITQEYENTARKEKKADLAIGLAYLMFRLWSLKGGGVKWRPLDVVENATEAPAIVQTFVDDAIAYALGAYEGLRKSADLKKKAYALNNYLYYLVEGGPDSQIPEMIRAAEMLTGFSTNTQVWQWRFDDTLARFFHRMATTKTKADDWLSAMNSARDHNEKACKGAYGDPLPSGYSSKIATAIQAGFGAILKPKRPPRVIRISKQTKRGM